MDASISLGDIPGDENPADILTKHLHSHLIKTVYEISVFCRNTCDGNLKKN
jgi:hypothetical protein